MTNPNDIERLQQTIESLKTEINRLAMPYEDALSHRVFDSTKKKILLYIGSWGTIITAVLAFLGFNAYDKIVEKATTMASDKYLEKAMPDIIKKTDLFVENGVKNIINEKIENIFLSMQEKFESEIPQLINAAQNQSDFKLNEALKQIGTKLQDSQFEAKTQKLIDSAVQKKQTTALGGWSFYGVFKDGKWLRKAFEIVGDKNNVMPSKQDKIQALTAVNIRKGRPYYSDSDGWNYPGVLSVINEGTITIAQDVQADNTPKGEYIWVQVVQSK